VPELEGPEPGVAGLVALEPVSGRPLVPEPLVPEPGVSGLVALGLGPGRSLVPEPGVAGLVVLEPVSGRPLVPEPLVPEPLLPAPEVWASTRGAVTTSTARAATIILLNLLNISLYSSNLYGCTLSVSLCEPYPCAPRSVGTVPARRRSNSYATGTRRTAHGPGGAMGWPGRRWSPPTAPVPALVCTSHSLILRGDQEARVQEHE
jgi:hypothetical protein